MAEALDNFKEAMMALVLVALVIAALALALNGFQDAIIEDIDATSVSNESVSVTNGTSATLFSGKCITDLSCSAVHNGSTDFVTTAVAPNVTISCTGSSITITDANDPGWGFVSSQVNVTYSCGVADYQYNVTKEGLEGTQNASSYLSTIGTLLGVAALIAVVVMAFYFVRR